MPAFILRTGRTRMLKWVIVLVISLVVLTALSPWLSRFGLGRLPGDITVRVRGRDAPLVSLLVRPSRARRWARSAMR